MAGNPTEAAPLLAQVPATRLLAQLEEAAQDGSATRTKVRRRAGLTHARRRSVSLGFLALGIVSLLGLSRAAAAAGSDGFTADDGVLLAMLTLISLVVASQAFSLLKTLPGSRSLWIRAARARMRRAGPGVDRPLLAQGDARSLLPTMVTPVAGGTTRRLRPAVTTAAWITLTLLIMAAAAAAVGLVVIALIRAIDSRGWSLGAILGLAFVALLGYGVTLLSIGLVRSWFERRRRSLRRMLMRLLRYLLRWFDRTTAALRRALGRFDRGTGMLGRAVLATGGAVLVVGASLSMPSATAGDVAANPGGSGAIPPSSTTTTVGQAVAVDHQNTPQIESEGAVPDDGGPALAVSGPAPAVTVATTSTSMAATTTSSSTTTTTVAKTTTTLAKPTTTTSSTTTTTTPPDTTGPVVGGISDGPDPIFTSGNPPDTSQVSASASDPSGVASMTVYYRLGGGGFSVWASVKGSAVNTTFGPFGTAGTYQYRIMATDALGNSNCKTPGSCPGGSVTVVIP